jgi:putative Holliday junction resolvase
MRALGLDIGSVRIGVALSDPDLTIATPHAVLAAADLARDPKALVRIIEEYEVDTVVIGLPTSLDGQEGQQAADVRAAAEQLAQALPVSVEYWDERLSSTEASRLMRSAGMAASKQRGMLDKVAAAIILQGWLDARELRKEQE